MTRSHAIIKMGARMSAAVISFEAELGILESGSVRLNDSVQSVDARAPKVAIMHRSRTANDAGLCYESASEVDLVSAAKNGDQHAFMELCDRYRPSLKRKIRGIVRNFEDAEDVLQDTLMSAFRHLAGFRANCTFRTWIMTIATNTSLMLLRKRKNRPETGFGLVTAEGKEFELVQITDPMPNPEQVCAKRQVSHRVSLAVSTLPPGVRPLVERYHQNEVRLMDAANEMGITVAAAKSRLMRARNILRRTLKRS